MIKKVIAMLSLTAVIVSNIHTAFAWSPTGHELIGTVAEQLLSRHAKKMLSKELGVPLGEAAKWPDCVRSVTKKSGEDFAYAPARPEYAAPCTAFETPAEKERMIDFVRRNWDNCSFIDGAHCHETYHFTDVAIQRDHYDRAYVGTNDHDVVAAINAALAKLQDRAVPPPFNIKDKKEALFLLTHFVGDIHVPLHVGVVYLGSDNRPIDPDHTAGAYQDINGGNALDDGTQNLHAEWDSIGQVADPSSATDLAALVKKARVERLIHRRAKPLRLGELATAWATDTLQLAPKAFAGISYSPNPERPGRWNITFGDRDEYRSMRMSAQRNQLVKASARLAYLLNRIWP